MTAVSLSKIKFPAYYAPNDGNIYHPVKDSLAVRVLYAALPFITLHKPFGKVITLTLDSLRVFSSLNQLFKNLKSPLQLLKTVLTVTALVSTIFLHPVGLFISSLYDLSFDLIALLTRGVSLELFSHLVSLTDHFFYLATMLTGSFEIIALSLLLNMFFEIFRSREEFKKGHIIEGLSHLIMSVVRGAQSLPYLEKATSKHEMIGKQVISSLTEKVAKIRNKLAVFFFSSARMLVSPHWKITENWLKTISLCKDDRPSTTKKIIEVTKSTFYSLTLIPFALGGLVLGQTFHFSAFLLSLNPYIHLKGQVAVQKLTGKKCSIFQQNTCLTAGGFSLPFGGIPLPNGQRVEIIAEMIRKNDPDLVCLQEVSDLKDALSFYEKLNDKYGEFFLNIGATPFILQNNSGLFIASKLGVERPEFQSFSEIEGTERMVNKGFFSFLNEWGHFISTHLSPSHDDLKPTESEIETRRKEQEELLAFVQNRNAKDRKTCFILGDFNINWNSSEYRSSLLFKEGKDKYNQGRSEVTEKEATAETDYLIDRNWRHEKEVKPVHLILDYFLSFFQKEGELHISSQKVDTFDLQNPEGAISDHVALKTDIKSFVFFSRGLKLEYSASLK
jgi:endonuclease/exonuclease/phosphatase family metal-dependent hydrolase